MKPNIYFDTSALAKWYLNEPRSDEVEEYILAQGPVTISDLTVVEMRSLLARRRMEKSIDPKLETEIFATFQEDIRKNVLICRPLTEGLAWGTANLISVLPDIPLRTLDALHLWIAKEIQAENLATADRIMAAGGQALGFTVMRFD
ncbi:MAG: type II toxin-antitoxin system VapC family toxin [Syntrophaceae bacterium]|nr:type II toxin-antitoxin system VapC family toxin [Syntrophaceae bacterium]